MLLLEILFNLFISSIVVLNFWDIEYKVSPFWTLYVVGCGGVVGSFIISFWPGRIVFDSKLFNSFNLLIDTLNFLEIEYNVSPHWTIYCSDVLGSKYGVFVYSAIAFTTASA